MKISQKTLDRLFEETTTVYAVRNKIEFLRDLSMLIGYSHWLIQAVHFELIKELDKITSLRYSL